MANPQWENNFTKIANEIMDSLAKIRIPGQARQILDFIIRKTYGWNKKTDMISLSQFVKGTGLSKVAVCKGINKLLQMQIIVKKGSATSLFTQKGNDIAITYGFQKNFDKWLPLPKKVTLPKKVKHVTQKGNETLPKKDTTKDTITKDTITKEMFLSDSIEIRLSELLFSLMLKNNPKAKQPNLQTWAKEFGLAMRIDKRTEGELEKVIRWTQEDSFEFKNILSPGKLRKRFDQLWLKSQKKNKPKYNFKVIN